MEKSKVVLLVRNAFSYDFGGGEKFPIMLAKELLENGYSPVVCSRSKQLLSEAQSERIKTQKSWWWSRQNWSSWRIALVPVYLLWLIILTCWYLNTIKRLSVDIVHLQSKDDFIAGTIAGKLLRKKVIWTDHADLKDVLKNVSIWYKNPVGKIVFWVSRHADTITTVSNSELELIKTQSGKDFDNIMVVYNGATDKAVEKIPSKSLTFILLSRLVIDKGIGEAINAFKEMKSSNYRLIICGDGPDAQKFKEIAAEDDRVLFEGHVTDIANALASADIYLHPSYREGFSLSLVEACMAGLPIIASNVGGNVEIVFEQKNGLLVEPKTVGQLRVAMEKLASNPSLREKYGAESRKIFLENFQFKDIVKMKFIPIYEK